MVMATDRSAIFAVPAAAALLLWPAVWNRYPIVFADTGTYLSQAIHRYAGWDRPVFYSLFLTPLHMTVTLWPVVIAQALLAAWALWLVCFVLAPGLPAIAFVAGAAALSIGSWLPWLVSEVMPDLLTPLLVLMLGLLRIAPDRLSHGKRWMVTAVATLMIASQQSSVPLAACSVLVLLFGSDIALSTTGAPASRPGGSLLRDSDIGLSTPMARRRFRAIPRFGRISQQTATFVNTTAVTRSAVTRGRLILVPPILAVLALCCSNLAAHGRFSLSPFGNVFLLARVIYDGPGMNTLRRECPQARWRLCPFTDNFPPTSDDFLWTADSPLNRAGGPKAVSADAAAIIAAAVITEPGNVAAAAAANAWEQLTRFASGDGLNPWPKEVAHWIEQDFPPSEAARYAAARQQAGLLHVPPPLARLHIVVALAGVAACLLLLPLAIIRRARCRVFLLAVLIALPVNAMVTGALSTPHDRYQSRMMWLPPFIAVISLVSLMRRAE